MSLKILLFFALAVCAEDQVDYKAKHARSVNECGKELKMDTAAFLPEEQRAMTEQHDPAKFSCMKKCIWGKLGYINASAIFQEATYHHDHPEIPATHIHIFKTCSKLYARNVTASCERFKDMEQCINTELALLHGKQIM